MEAICGVTLTNIDELQSLEIQGDQIEGESGVTRSTTDEIHSSDI